MKKQPIKLDMSAFMDAYTKQWNAEQKYNQEVRDGLRPAPQRSTVWDISDRA